ncbi:MAG: hypothetical protein U0V70_17480 [Terriglobia bacterium]
MSRAGASIPYPGVRLRPSLLDENGNMERLQPPFFDSMSLMMFANTRLQQAIRVVLCLFVFSIAIGGGFYTPSLTLDPLKPTTIQKPDTTPPITLRSEKQSKRVFVDRDSPVPLSLLRMEPLSARTWIRPAPPISHSARLNCQERCLRSPPVVRLIS